MARQERLAAIAGGCIVAPIVVLLGVALLILGLWPSDHVRDLLFVEREEPPLPQGIPAGLDLICERGYYYRLTADEQSFTIPYDRTAKIEILFQERWSLTGNSLSTIGKWKGMNARLVITEPYNATFNGETQNESWDEALAGGSVSFTPWLKVGFPIEKECYRKTIRALATMDIVYPQATKSGWGPVPGRFSNEQAHLERQIELFVISPDDVGMLNKHKAWEQFNKEKQNTVVIVFYATVAIALISIGVFVIAAGLYAGYDSLRRAI